MLSRNQLRELLAVGLTGVALFLVLALAPADAVANHAPGWVPSDNLMGRLGVLARDGLITALGGAALLLPLLLALAAFRVGDWGESGLVTRLVLFCAGLMVIVPATLHVVGTGARPGGVAGEALGPPVEGAVGWLGTVLLAVVAFAALSVATLGRNPFRVLLGGVAGAFRAGWRALAATVEGVARGARWLYGSDAPGAVPEPAAQGDGVGVPGPEGGGVVPPPSGPPTAEPRGEPGEAGAPAPEAQRGTGGRRKKGGRRGERDAPEGDTLPDPLSPEGLAAGAVPPLDLLEPASRAGRGDLERQLDRLGDVLIEKLRTFKVQSELGGRTTGPVVTQFEVIPAPGVKVNRIANLDADLALAMEARSVRIVAPIPGKGAVGVEIPNPTPEKVTLREILESREYRSSGAELPLALGKDLHGEPYVADLAKMPHALIAGATGSGKSVCINTIITSLVYRHTPETLRLLMVDPKMVELSTYSHLPHLRHPVVTDPAEAAGVLKWAVLEMERRYALLSENGVRSIAEFNRRVTAAKPLRHPPGESAGDDPEDRAYEDGPLPYMVLVVDELADLMMNVQGEIEKPLTHLAQKARAIGIHLIVATQRPSVNVVTGLIKANFPCRIGFRVSSKTDSRTILDQNGADALLGDGDMLFLPPGRSDPARVQGAFIATEETERLMDWYREKAGGGDARDRDTAAAVPSGEEEDILEVVRALEAEEAQSQADAAEEERDDYFREAAELCIRSQQGSTSLLQRKLRIGYGRAARIIDQLYEAGVLGPPDGSRPREVLVSFEQLDQLLGDSELGAGPLAEGSGRGVPSGGGDPAAARETDSDGSTEER